MQCMLSNLAFSILHINIMSSIVNICLADSSNYINKNNLQEIIKIGPWLVTV